MLVVATVKRRRWLGDLLTIKCDTRNWLRVVMMAFVAGAGRGKDVMTMIVGGFAFVTGVRTAAQGDMHHRRDQSQQSQDPLQRCNS